MGCKTRSSPWAGENLQREKASLKDWVGGKLAEGNGKPLLYSCLGNPMGRGAWPATVLGAAKELDPT